MLKNEVQKINDNSPERFKRQQADKLLYRYINIKFLCYLILSKLTFGKLSEKLNKRKKALRDIKAFILNSEVKDNSHDTEKNAAGEMFYCPLCQNESQFEPYSNRKNVLCPICSSLERHRFLYFLYSFLFLQNQCKLNVLHMAPEKIFYQLFVKKENINYTCIDLYPEKYKYAQNIQKMNCLNLTLPEKSFDIIIHNHVMEHISDEQLFIDEQLRVLKDDGMIIMSIPYSSTLEHTLEDPSINTDELRLKHYNQEDHVRLYGLDMLQNLKNVRIENYSVDIMTPLMVKMCCLDGGKGYFVLRKIIEGKDDDRK